MAYAKNVSNWLDLEGQKMDMTQNSSLLRHKGNFPRKSKNNETTQICLKYNLSTSLLSTLMTTSNAIEWMKNNDMIANPDKFKATVLTKLIIIQLVLDCNLQYA